MRLSKKTSLIVAAFLLAMQFLLQLHLARTDSLTTDEGIHLYAGYRYIKYGDFSYNPEHPPLVKYLAGLPLAFMDLDDPEGQDEYSRKTQNFFFWGDPQQSTVAENFLYNSGNDPEKIVFAARVPMAILTLLLGALVFAVAVYAWGWGGGLLAVFLYSLDPTITGHGHLVTTDIGFSFGALLSVFTLWLFLKNQSSKNALLFGGSVGIMMLTKFSALVFLPIFALLVTAKVFMDRKEYSFQKMKGFLGKLLLAVGMAWIVLIVGYQFQFSIPPYQESVVEAAASANNIVNPWLPNTSFINDGYNAVRHVLFPADYFRGLFSFINHASFGHGSYFFGEHSITGWRHYFAVLFTAKLFVPTLILLGTAFYLALRHRKIVPFATYLCVAAVLFVILSSVSKVNIGVRHIMPAFPFAFVLIGSLAYFATDKIKKLSYVIIGAVVLVAIEFVSISPYYLSYFNQLYGGTWNGYKMAVDSNLDWGQDLYRIKQYVDENAISEPVYVEYFWGGLSSLRHVGIPYHFLSDFKREEDRGYIVISATALVQDKYKWLRNYPVYDRITPSVFVFKL